MSNIAVGVDSVRIIAVFLGSPSVDSVDIHAAVAALISSVCKEGYL